MEHSSFVPESNDLHIRLADIANIATDVNDCVLLRVNLYRVYPTSRPSLSSVGSFWSLWKHKKKQTCHLRCFKAKDVLSV